MRASLYSVVSIASVAVVGVGDDEVVVTQRMSAPSSSMGDNGAPFIAASSVEVGGAPIWCCGWAMNRASTTPSVVVVVRVAAMLVDGVDTTAAAGIMLCF